MLDLTDQQILIVKSFQTSLIIVGFIFNIQSAVIVFKYRIFHSQFTKYVIRNQFLIDTTICFLSPFILWVAQDLYDSDKPLDVFVCYIWTSQCVYWTMCSLSNQNLVWTAIDRYLAVIHPTIYKMKKKVLVIIYVTLISTISISTGIQVSQIVHIRNNTCSFITTSESYILQFATLSYTIVNYIIPVFIFSICYCQVIVKLRTMKDNSNCSEEFRKSTVKFTIACFANSVMFIALLMMDNVLFILRSFSTISFGIGSDIQIISLFLVSLNSCINPFIYLLALKNFRRYFSLSNIFCYASKVSPDTSGLPSSLN